MNIIYFIHIKIKYIHKMSTVEQMPASFTVQELEILELVKGKFEIWNTSMAETFKDDMIKDINLLTASWALLAHTEFLFLKCDRYKGNIVIIRRLIETGFIEIASNILRLPTMKKGIPHQLITNIHYVSTDKKNFNPYVNIKYLEMDCLVNEASAWTLVKWINAQLRAGINKCYNFLPDTEIVSYKDIKQGVRVRTPEGSSYNNYTSELLVNIIDILREKYNKMLITNIDFSQAYNQANAIKKQLVHERLTQKSIERAQKMREVLPEVLPLKVLKSQVSKQLSQVKEQYTKPQVTEPQDTKLQDTKLQDTKLQDTKLQDTKLQYTKLQDTKLQDNKPLVKEPIKSVWKVLPKVEQKVEPEVVKNNLDNQILDNQILDNQNLDNQILDNQVLEPYDDFDKLEAEFRPVKSRRSNRY